MFWDLYEMVVRVNIYILKRLFFKVHHWRYMLGIMRDIFPFFFSFAHNGEDATLGYSHASRSQLSSDCLIPFVKSVSASPIFRSVVGPPRCSIPTIRLIITNKSSQRGSWELDSLHSSAPPPHTAANSDRNSHWSAGGYGAMGFLSLFGISNSMDKWLACYAICSAKQHPIFTAVAGIGEKILSCYLDYLYLCLQK